MMNDTMIEAMPHAAMLIDGKAAIGGNWLTVINPATGAAIGHAPDCTRAQLDEAVAAAGHAFLTWRKTTMAERREVVAQISATLAENAPELAALLTSEQGKPIADATAEILGSAYWCQGLSALDLPVSVTEDGERRIETRRVPLGVVAAISPWNYPVLLSMFKVVPALLAGNSVVLKPSPYTPLTVLRIAELLRDVVPAGVLNVVTGGDALGPWMSSHPGFAKISFTGSTAVGRNVMAQAANTLKRVTLELGGNDAAIVLPDVDVETVAPELFWAALRNSGQLCIAAKRIYIHEDVYASLSRALVDYAASIKVGDGADPATRLGPIQNERQYRRLCALLDEARASGLAFLCGGEPIPGDGFMIPVTIVDNPPEDAPIVAEEQFGPIMPLLRYADLDEVVERVNRSEFGLGATIWTADAESARDLAARIEAGTVWINESQHLSPLVPFSGHKQSGIGVENGIEGLIEYTNSKTTISKKSQI